ncbi:MAG: amidase [Angustibacter sp.]
MPILPGTTTRGGSGALDPPDRFLDSTSLHRRYAAGEVTPTEHVSAVLDAVRAHDPRLRAFLTVDADGAMSQARRAEDLLRSCGRAALETYPLLGLPVSVKDLTPTAGMRTTRGSLATRDWVPQHDATAVARLRRAGAVIIGKTNTSEDGWSASTCNRLGPATGNPWDLSRSAGGSSGGAAAAVAAGLGVAATGTDGAGSIRIPAAFCGVVGFKPTFGRVPYDPLSPERLSHLGALARSVADVERLVSVMAGPDPHDPYSLDAPAAEARPTRRRLRIGWLPQPGGVAPSVLAAERCSRAVAALAERGHHVTLVVETFEDPYPVLVVILAAAAAADHRPEHDSVADPDRLAVVKHGLRLTAADLIRAERERALLCRRLYAWTARFDVLAMPTVPVAPFDRAAWRPDTDGGALDWLAWAPACYPFNLSGQPAVSVPVGHDETGLPVGLQLVAARHRDEVALAAARELETAMPWQPSYRHLETM